MSEDERLPRPDPNRPTIEAKAITQSITSDDEIITGEVGVESGQLTGPDLQAAQRQARVPEGALGLFPGDSQEPILYTGPDRVVLGRASLPLTSAIVDLTPFDANELGVSRRHAAITLSGSQYVLEDLGSLNGTWLHDARLPLYVQRPLQNGDVFRLGQLKITVYLHSVAPATPAPTAQPRGHDFGQPQAQPQALEPALDASGALSVGAEDLVFNADGLVLTLGQPLTTDLLANNLFPYLAALEQLQALIDAMQRRQSRALAILQIRSMPSIAVTVSGAGDAIKLARTLIARWRQKHTSEIEMLIAAQGSQAEPPLSVEKAVAIEVSEAEVTAEILARLGSKLPPSELAGYARQLIEPVKALLLSPIGVEPESEANNPA